MKKIVFFLALLAITSQTFAKSSERELSTEIQTKIAVPKLCRENPGDYRAEVKFRIAENGTTEIVSVNTPDPELRESVYQEFRKLHLEPSGKDAKTLYSIVLRFHVL
ncbi:MAG: hypothetical protein U0T73_13400 [Chitinophagales bacterium]